MNTCSIVRERALRVFMPSYASPDIPEFGELIGAQDGRTKWRPDLED